MFYALVCKKEDTWPNPPIELRSILTLIRLWFTNNHATRREEYLCVYHDNFEINRVQSRVLMLDRFVTAVDLNQCLKQIK